jgi:hypothetical protein
MLEEYLEELARASYKLPTDDSWDERDDLKKITRRLLTSGLCHLGRNEVILDLVSRLPDESWVATLYNEGTDTTVYGNGDIVADAVLAALVQMEVEIMILNVKACD